MRVAYAFCMALVAHWQSAFANTTSSEFRPLRSALTEIGVLNIDTPAADRPAAISAASSEISSVRAREALAESLRGQADEGMRLAAMLNNPIYEKFQFVQINLDAVQAGGLLPEIWTS